METKGLNTDAQQEQVGTANVAVAEDSSTPITQVFGVEETTADPSEKVDQPEENPQSSESSKEEVAQDQKPQEEAPSAISTEIEAEDVDQPVAKTKSETKEEVVAESAKEENPSDDKPSEQHEAAVAKPEKESSDETTIDEPEKTVASLKEQTEDETEEAVAGAKKEAKDPESEFAGKSRQELVDILADIINNRPIQHQRKSVDAIKILFYKAARPEMEAAKEEFVKNGGTEEEFKPEPDALELRLKELLSEYRRKRDDYVNNIEKHKDSNYEAKLAIIEELKELTNSSETLHNTFTAFRELQTRWKDAGLVPQEKLKDLWDTYNHHVENFYNYIKINKELRDIDLKRNYEAKVILCEEAEALILDPSATNAFHKLQKLHEQWREIGPINTEVKEQLWERFKEASTRINKRHQEYFDIIKEEQKKNLALKEELCQKVEEFATQPFTSRKEWGDASEQIAEIQKIWKTIGFAPRKDNTRIYDRFRKGCDRFFEAKREYFNQLKGEMDDNLQQKIDLCVQAEALSESDDWKATTEAIKELQKKWKESGPTSRKHADAIWKRFRAACDKFFENKAAHFSEADSKYSENLKMKQDLLVELKAALEDTESLTFDKVKEYQRRWSEIGFVPIKQKDSIHKQYKEVVDEIFIVLRGNEKGRKFDNFRSRISTMKEGGGSRKVNQEREKLYNRVRQIESDIQIWENNVGFFAKSKNAESLTKEVYTKIEKARAEIAELVEKVNLIDQQNKEAE